MPLLLAFPMVIVTLLIISSQRTDALLSTQLVGDVAGARNYLDTIKAEAEARISELVRSERLKYLVESRASEAELSQALYTAARGSGLDYLLVAAADGTVLGSSTGVTPGRRLPDSYVVRQARLGVASAAYERFDASQLDAFSPRFPQQARVESDPPPDQRHPPVPAVESHGLLINAGTHFPLSVKAREALLVGGILLNNNSVLIDHMREIIYPVGALPDNVEGMTALYLDGASIAVSRQRLQGLHPGGLRAPAQALTATVNPMMPWQARQQLGELDYLVGYAPVLDGDGQRIGMVGAGFPDEPYRRMTWWLLTLVSALLGLTMLGISAVFLRVGGNLSQRLAQMADTMAAVGRGNREARVELRRQEDEIDLLAQHFNELLNTIAEQEAERQAGQQAIADEAARRRALFQHERDGVVILDADGRVFEANATSAAMLGYGLETLEKLDVSGWDESFTRADRGQRLRNVGPEGQFYETTHRRQDGGRYLAEVSMSRVEWGGKTFVLMLMRDITARKLLEIEREDYFQLYRTSPDLMCICNATGSVARMNPAGQNLLGYAETELQALPFIELVHPDDRRRTLDEIAGQPRGQPGRNIENRLVSRDGRVYWFLWTSYYDDRGFIYAVAHNITALKQNEADLKIARAAAESASAAKSEFLAHMSHEIRTPLNGVLGLAQVLGREPLTPNQRELVERLQGAGQSLLAIINDILDFSKIEAGQLQVESRPFVLGGPLARVESLLGQTARAKGLELRLDTLPGPLGPLLGDGLRLEQVLVNLTGNAIKFTERGEVTLTVRVREASATEVRLRFEVRDTGIGIAPEALARLFTPFTQAEAGITRRYGGTGLGLAICKRLVELMGGTIGAESRAGQGSLFWFELPFRRAEGNEPAIPPGPAPACHTGSRLAGLRVLVVDDSALNREVVERGLALEGATAILAADGQQAIQQLTARPGAVDAVLMDVQMPVLDGLTATRIIRSELGLTDLPILALTAGVLPEQQAAARAAGVNEVLTKPLELEHLTATLLRWVKPRPAVVSPALRPAPPAGPEPAEAIPALAGIVRARAAQPLWHDRALFLRLLDGLVTEFADVVDRVRRDLAAGDRETATRRLHTLRGNAGHLGALELMRTAGELEEALLAGQTDLEAGLATLGRQLGELTAASAPWRQNGATPAPAGLAQPGENAAAAPAGTMHAVDVGTLQPKVQALAAMLAIGQSKARPLSTEIERLLAGTALQHPYVPIARAIARLDFDAALAQLQALARHHAWNWLDPT